jgi:hypothetical protein
MRSLPDRSVEGAGFSQGEPSKMPDQRAEDHLHAMEYLLERSGSYQASSARTALVGGLLSIALAGAMLASQMRVGGRNLDARTFSEQWALVFLATLASAVLFLSREAQRRGERFVYGGLRLAVSAIIPSLFAGGAISGCITLTSGLPLFPALFWVVFYGLALLSMRHFAPPGLSALGWAFLFTGIAAFIYLMNETIMPEFDLPTPTNLYPAALMGATFGCYHLIYAACCWPRRALRNADIH